MFRGASHWKPAVTVLLVACSTGGCDRSTVGSVATALSEREQLDFNYLLLQPNGDGLYVLRMNYATGCTDYLFDANQLSDMLRTKQFELTRTIGGGPTTVTATFTFDKLGECFTPGEVKYENDALSEPVQDANGNITGRKRPQSAIGTKLVDPELSSAGVMNVLAYDINIVGQTTNQTPAPGNVQLTTAEVPATLVGAPSGVFAASNMNPAYSEASLADVLSNPDRFTGAFSFLAKPDPASDQILLVWDGDIVLRTDL
jgi:hypothetical protein